MRYAIGEIILVVIGILIALLINNWNDNRKDSIQEKIVLRSLLENLNQSKTQSELLMSEEYALKKRLMWILGLELIENSIESEIIPDSIFKMEVWDLQSDEPKFKAYGNLKNTNKLSLIKNKKLIEKLTDLEFSLNKLNDMLEDR